MSLHGFAWVGHFLVDDFRVFRRKTQLFGMVHRKKNYVGILNSFDSGNPRNNGEETVRRVQIVVLSRRRVSLLAERGHLKSLFRPRTFYKIF